MSHAHVQVSKASFPALETVNESLLLSSDFLYEQVGFWCFVVSFLVKSLFALTYTDRYS
jgi:hypothetical protein